MGQLYWAQLTGKTQWHHLARSHYGPGRRCHMHSHDFAEVCWIESGILIEESPATQRPLSAGQGLFIRPEHCHAFRGTHSGTILVNIAFPLHILDELSERYPSSLYSQSEATTAFTLDRAARSHLRQHLNMLPLLHEHRYAVDAFLMTLASHARRPRGVVPSPALPEWLQQAFEECSRPPKLAIGPQALSSLTGKSREHIARICKKLDGRTPTAIFQAMRLNYAAEILQTDTATIAEIAGACGYANVAHFHRLFHKRFQQTPGGYRKAAKITSG